MNPDMQGLMAQAQQMQAQMEAAQREISQTTVEGQAGGGLVKVTMLGTGDVTGVTIDPKVIDPEDPETLQDLIVGALGDATGTLQKLAEEKLGPLAGGMGGLDEALGGFLN